MDSRHPSPSKDDYGRFDRRTDGMPCPCCRHECRRESVDIGVGIQYGPWGCSSCGWSEHEEYDCRDGINTDSLGNKTDQRGILYPKGGHENP